MKMKTIPELTEKNKRMFWAKIDKTPGLGPEGSCWVWTASVNKACARKGYGHFWVGGKNYASHRISYTLKHGQIPKGLHVLHKCDNPRCCNPDHLFLGTQKDNVRDMAQKGRAKYPLVLRGTDNVASKLQEDQVLEIRRRYATGGISHKALARKYGVNAALICYIVNRKIWSHLPQSKDEIIKNQRRGSSKLTEDQVLEIRRRYARGGISQTTLAREFGISRGLISLIANRKVWRHI